MARQWGGHLAWEVARDPPLPVQGMWLEVLLEADGQGSPVLGC